MQTAIEPLTLRRGLRRWDLVGVAINGVVGAGIFGLPSEIYRLTGPYSLLAFVATGLLIALLALCMAEVSSRFTEAGGQYLYAREALGPTIGFHLGWLMWLARISGFAAVCNLFVVYVGHFWPAATAGLWRAVLITAVTATLTAMNVVGVRPTAVVSNIFAVCKLGCLALFVAAGLFFVDVERFTGAATPELGPFSTAIVILVFAFGGFGSTGIPASEAREPRRDLPFAFLTAVGTTTVLYVLIQFVCIGTLPQLGSSERPLADAGSHFLGAAAGTTVAVAAIVSIAGTMNMIMLVSPRVIYAIAEQGQLPRGLAAVHSRFRTPYVAILLTGAGMLVLTLTGTFIYTLTINSIITLVAYMCTCSAMLILRRRSDPPAMFMVVAGNAVAVMGLLLCGLLLWTTNLHQTRDVVIAAAVGSVLYFGHKVTRGR